MGEVVQPVKKNWVKTLFETLFLIALTVLALAYILKDDPGRTFALLKEANFFPLLLALAVIFAGIFLEALSITLLARLYQPKFHYLHGLINVLVGESVGIYVKAGGSVIQEITFTKQGIDVADGASILTMNFLVYQFSICLYSALIVIFGTGFVQDVPLDLLGGMRIFWIGILSLALQLSFLLIILALAYWRGLHRFVLNTGINFLAKIHILKKPEETRRRLTIQFATYRIEMKRLARHKGLVATLLGIDLLKAFLNALVPLIVLTSLGADIASIGYVKAFFGAGYVQVISNSIGVGAPEIAFQAIFTNFLSPRTDAANLASAANLLWRALSFYLLSIVGLISLLSYQGAPKIRKVLSHTGTIYDLDLRALTDGDNADKEYMKEIHKGGRKKNGSVLQEEEMKASFLLLKANMMEPIEEEKPLTDDAEVQRIIEEQNKRLAEIEKETYEAKKKKRPDSEIRKEADKDFAYQKEKEAKKAARRAKREAKRDEKTKKKLAKNRPVGSHVSFSSDEDGSSLVSFTNDSFALSSSLSSSPKEQEEKDNGNQEERKDHLRS